MSKSLEEAIGEAKIAIIDAEKVVIENLFPSLKKRKLIETSLGEFFQKNNQNSNESFRLQVVELVQSKDEEIHDLENQIEISKLRINEMSEYIKLMEEKLKHLEKRLKPSDSEVSNSIIDKTTIKFYEIMTSMKIEVTSDHSRSDKFSCDIENPVKSRRVKFSLQLRDDEYIYTPIESAKILPEYLHDEISFEKGMAPVLMGDVLQALYDEN